VSLSNKNKNVKDGKTDRDFIRFSNLFLSPRNDDICMIFFFIKNEINLGTKRKKFIKEKEHRRFPDGARTRRSERRRCFKSETE